MERKRPDTKASLSSALKHSQKQREQEWLQELAQAEDTDPFCADIEIRAVHALLEFGISRPATTVAKASAKLQASSEFFVAWHRRKNGISGICIFLAERLARCKGQSL